MGPSDCHTQPGSMSPLFIRPTGCHANPVQMDPTGVKIAIQPGLYCPLLTRRPRRKKALMRIRRVPVRLRAGPRRLGKVNRSTKRSPTRSSPGYRHSGMGRWRHEHSPASGAHRSKAARGRARHHASGSRCSVPFSADRPPAGAAQTVRATVSYTHLTLPTSDLV